MPSETASQCVVVNHHIIGGENTAPMASSKHTRRRNAAFTARASAKKAANPSANTDHDRAITARSGDNSLNQTLSGRYAIDHHDPGA